MKEISLNVGIKIAMEYNEKSLFQHCKSCIRELFVFLLIHKLIIELYLSELNN